MEKLQVYCQGGRIWLYPFLEVKFILKIYRLLTRVAGTVNTSSPIKLVTQVCAFFFQLRTSFERWKNLMKILLKRC